MALSGFEEELKKLKNLDYDQAVIDNGKEAKIEVESYAHWLVTAFNLAKIY